MLRCSGCYGGRVTDFHVKMLWGHKARHVVRLHQYMISVWWSCAVVRWHSGGERTVYSLGTELPRALGQAELSSLFVFACVDEGVRGQWAIFQRSFFRKVQTLFAKFQGEMESRKEAFLSPERFVSNDSGIACIILNCWTVRNWDIKKQLFEGTEEQSKLWQELEQIWLLKKLRFNFHGFF